MLHREHIQPIPAIGLCIVITIQKTKTPVKLPLCDEAIELMGNRGTEKVFKGLKRSMTGKPLKDWITAAGITKHITFHCFRHTYSTLREFGISIFKTALIVVPCLYVRAMPPACFQKTNTP